jgi:hypothetical protein
MEITSELKDSLLRFLVENCSSGYGQIDRKSICAEFSIDIDTLHAVLEMFKTKNFLKKLGIGGAATHLAVDVCISGDFLKAGGFQAEEQFSKLQMQKLQLEVQKLQFEVKELAKSLPEASAAFEKIVSIAGNIASIAGLFV